jgi:L-lactate dehydrogenase complex protein LldE
MNDFADAQYIVMPSASCAGFVRNYYSDIYDKSSNQKEIKALQSRVYELSDFLVNVMKVDDFGAKLNCKATYHDSCAALREYKLKHEPRQLLSKVKGLELIELADNETCCGFGGTFSVKYEPISAAMGEQKATHIVNTGADVLISTDLSCLMHIGGVMDFNKMPVKSMHLADVLASGY